MVDPIKRCTGINLHDPSLLPTLQSTLQFMGHACKYITGTQTFPISKLGGWKHTTAFNKSSKTNKHQALKHLRQYWCYGNRSVIGNRGGRWTFRNWGDIGLSPPRWKNSQTNKPQKHNTKTWAITSAVHLRKGGNIPKGSVPPYGSKSNKRRLTSLDLKAKETETDGKWEADQQPLWTACCQNDPASNQPYQPSHTPVHHPH